MKLINDELQDRLCAFLEGYVKGTHLTITEAKWLYYETVRRRRSRITEKEAPKDTL